MAGPRERSWHRAGSGGASHDRRVGWHHYSRPRSTGADGARQARSGRSGPRGGHRAGRCSGNPRLARDTDRRGRGRPRRRDPDAGGGSLRGLHGRARGGGAARRGHRALRRQGRREGRRGRARRDRPGDRRYRRAGAARGRPEADRPRRQPGQVPARRERPARGEPRGGPGGGRVRRAGAVPLHRGPQRPRAAGADDEHPQRRCPRGLRGRRPGVHDRSHRRGVVPGGPALGRGGLPGAEGGAEEEGSVHRPRGRGRVRPLAAEQPRGARPHHRRDR